MGLKRYRDSSMDLGNFMDWQGSQSQNENQEHGDLKIKTLREYLPKFKLLQHAFFVLALGSLATHHVIEICQAILVISQD